MPMSLIQNYLILQWKILIKNKMDIAMLVHGHTL